MRRFSIGEAIGDGFGLIGRRPLSVFIWGLLVLAPVLASFALLLPTMGDVFANMPPPGSDSASDEVFPEQMFARMVQLQLVSMLVNIGQLLCMVVVYTAIMRAVLRPREDGFFSLRIGMDELRVAVVGLAIGVAMYVAMIAAVLIGAAVVAALWSVDQGVAVGVGILIGLGAVVATCWAVARASLLAPASVLNRDFAFVDGWRLAAGKGWPLFGMMVATLLIILVIEVLLVAVAMVAFSGAWAASGLSWAELSAGFNPVFAVEGWLAANWPWAVLGGIVLSMAYGALLTISIAPFASACRQLTNSGASATAFDEAGLSAPAP